VRLALGGTRRDIIALILRQGSVPLLTGVVAGLLVAAAAGRLIRNGIYGLSPLDPVAFLGVTALIAVVALVAMAQPARRAANVDPAATLRAD
jgi:ABC-type antimicrobial peptide transport system permease subunit